MCVNLLLRSTNTDNLRLQDGFDVLLRSATQNQFVVLYFLRRSFCRCSRSVVLVITSNG